MLAAFPVEGEAAETEVFADQTFREEFHFLRSAGSGKTAGHRVHSSHNRIMPGKRSWNITVRVYEVVNTYELDSERVDLNCRRR